MPIKSSMLDSLTTIFLRGLNTLSKEVDAFEGRGDFWESSEQFPNSAGNLTLHLVGNLQQFIGATLGGSSYIRQRAQEFSDKNLAISDLQKLIESTKDVVQQTLSSTEESKLSEKCPVDFLGPDATWEMFLIHLVSHFSYHLGQINHIRRSASLLESEL